MMRYLGIDAADALRMSTHINRTMLRDGQHYDSIAPGKYADLIAFDGDPLDSIAQLQESVRFIDIWMNGAKVVLPDMPADIPCHPSESSQGMWNRVYTRESVKGRLPADTRLPRGGLGSRE